MEFGHGLADLARSWLFRRLPQVLALVVYYFAAAAAESVVIRGVSILAAAKDREFNGRLPFAAERALPLHFFHTRFRTQL